MGIYGFVCAGGGSVGVLLGGVLTDTLSWHWTFLVNIPIGIAVFVSCMMLIPRGKPTSADSRLDVGGAITVTASLMLAVYAIVNGNHAGWTSTQTLVQLGIAAALMALFIAIESKVRNPLMPLRMWRNRNVTVSNITAVLWAASMFAWFFLSALYMQLVLGYTPMQVGLAFLPANLLMAVFSVGLSAMLVMRFGIRLPMGVGLLLGAIALALFARAPVGGSFMIDVLPGMVLLGLGGGISFTPMFMAAMNDVDESESGLASGMLNTAFMMGGALGLAILASLAAARTEALTAAGVSELIALNGGYQLAFVVGAFAGLIAAGLGGFAIVEGKRGKEKGAEGVTSQ
jgi:MFS family permease